MDSTTNTSEVSALTPALSANQTSRVTDLHISGMTCASCVARVERKLGKLDGVHASVDLATESARVVAPLEVAPETLIEAVRAAGYDASPRSHADTSELESEHRERDLRKRLWVAAVAGVPVVAVSMVMPWQFAGWQWCAAVLSAPIAWWCAFPFHRVALRQLRHGSSSMDTLVSLGVLAAWLGSMYATVQATFDDGTWRIPAQAMPGHDSPHVWFEVAAGVTIFLLLGRLLEHRATRQSGAAIRALLALQAVNAKRLRADRTTEEIPTEFVLVNDLLIVNPGDVVPVDGVIVEGETAVDESMLTGESLPVTARVSDALTGGTIAVTGRVVMRATAVGAATRIAQIGELVLQAQSRKSATQRLADRVSAVFVPVVLLITAATAAVWVALGHPDTAVTAALAVLVVACPCALGLATPTAMLAGVGRGAQLGILVSGPEVLESASRIDTLLFDKTGTVTTGQLNVVASEGADSLGVGQWRALSALAAASTHPASRAITAHAQAVGPFEQTTLTDIHESAGFGISASADGNTLRLGRPEWSAATVTDARTANDELGDTHTAPDSLSPAVASWRLDGWSVVAFSINGAVRVHFAIADTVRPESADVIAASQQLGMKAFLVTGDHAEVARHVASQVGIPADNVISSAKPEEKVSAVRDLQKQGHRVAMVGDGINDAAALATANIGIAMGAGTGAAIAAGDITVVGSRLELVLPALRLANRTLTTTRSNLAWAFGYNIIMIPLAAAGALNPMIAGFAMASSSVIVVTNSLRLRRFSV